MDLELIAAVLTAGILAERSYPGDEKALAEKAVKHYDEILKLLQKNRKPQPQS